MNQSLQPLSSKSRSVTVTGVAGNSDYSTDAALLAAMGTGGGFAASKAAHLADSALLTTAIVGRTAFRHLRDNGDAMVQAVHIEMVQLADSSRLSGSPLILQIVKLKAGNWQLRWRVKHGSNFRYIQWPDVELLLAHMNPTKQRHYRKTSVRALELTLMDTLLRHQRFWVERFLEESKDIIK
jgi:hypothetical protein